MECPNICGLQRYIDDAEKHARVATDSLAGFAGLLADMRDSPDPTVFNKISAAIQQRIEVGRGNIVDVLAERPKLAEDYFTYIDTLSSNIERDEQAQAVLRSQCAGGPTERLQYILFGRKVMRCNSRAFATDNA